MRKKPSGRKRDLYRLEEIDAHEFVAGTLH